MVDAQRAGTAEVKRSIRFHLAEDDVLLFLHIPKTAGLSFISLLDAQFEPNMILDLHSIPSELNKELWTELLWAESQHLSERIRLIRGHFSFGPYDALIWRYIVQNPVIITLLRHPVERTISAYRHLSRRPNRHTKMKGKSLLDWVTGSGSQQRVNNRMTRFIARTTTLGGKRDLAPRGLSNEAMLEIAMRRLEQFPFVGLTERFEDSVQLLHFTFGWENPLEIPRINAAPTPTRREDISPTELDAIRERTVLDAELYRFAVSIFEERWGQLSSDLGTTTS